MEILERKQKSIWRSISYFCFIDKKKVQKRIPEEWIVKQNPFLLLKFVS